MRDKTKQRHSNDAVKVKYHWAYKNLRICTIFTCQRLNPHESFTSPEIRNLTICERNLSSNREVIAVILTFLMIFFPVTSYRITVHTGDIKDAGTQSNVSIMLFGEKGNSPKLRLDKSETYNTKFCRDQLDIFTVYNIPQLGHLHKVQIWHDMTGPKHEWFVKGFYVEDKSTRKVYFFNCNAWIGRDGDAQDIKCEGYTLPDGKHLRLAFA